MVKTVGSVCSTEAGATETNGALAHTSGWLKMPNGPEMTTRTRDEAVKLAAVSADTASASHQWWK
jgi:hypothetical protein